MPNFKINDEPMNSRVVSRKASEGSYLQQKHRKQSRRGPYSADCTPELRRSSSVTPHRFWVRIPPNVGNLVYLTGKYRRQLLPADASLHC